MASLKLLLPLFLFLFLFSAAAADPAPPPLPTPVPSLVDAAETLANSGYIAMSFTLQLIAPILPLPSAAITPLTIFAPPDAAFVSSGQPSLAHLLLHFSPVSLSPAALLSFPISTPHPPPPPPPHKKKTTTKPTTDHHKIGVSRVPILDDGFVVVYAVDNLFDLNFTVLTNFAGINPRSDFQCAKLASISRFVEPARVLKSRGRSIMASFLELQLLGFIDVHGGDWTVFAPSDHELVKFSGDFLQYSSLFTRHLAACRVGWSDIEEKQNATAEMKNAKGFPLIISKDKEKEMLMVNGVGITFPDMYVSEWLVIHGVGGVIPLPELLEEEESAQES